MLLLLLLSLLLSLLFITKLDVSVTIVVPETDGATVSSSMVVSAELVFFGVLFFAYGKRDKVHSWSFYEP